MMELLTLIGLLIVLWCFTIPFLNSLLGGITQGGCIKLSIGGFKDRKSPIYKLEIKNWLEYYTVKKYEIGYEESIPFMLQKCWWLLFVPFSGLFRFKSYIQNERTYGEWYEQQDFPNNLKEYYESEYKQEYTEELKELQKEQELKDNIERLNKEFTENYK